MYSPTETEVGDLINTFCLWFLAVIAATSRIFLAKPTAEELAREHAMQPEDQERWLNRIRIVIEFLTSTRSLSSDSWARLESVGYKAALAQYEKVYFQALGNRHGEYPRTERTFHSRYDPDTGSMFLKTYFSLHTSLADDRASMGPEPPPYTPWEHYTNAPSTYVCSIRHSWHF